ncbi:non-specific lipid-transfer protein-like protein At2g13820 [Momordica charantia]|uniref:Non-specific lipid-transfer protein-like protein At2g13820 n=1 Tax=Momordica charantia TaxID=3673 RepID=A0A6J1CAW2_MOMCH|nr:non-specific lipid-transfer protein-like protein At2g13820 [Momordica charantia]
MEARKMGASGVVLVVVAMTVLWAGAGAQSSDCSNVLISLSPCLNYITGNSSTPSSRCCSQLGSVVRSQPQCLCQVLNGGASALGINVNQTLALALPGACRLQTPPISRCNANSPADSPAETPESPSEEPAGGGSKTVPTTEDGTSNGSSIFFSKSLLFIALLLVTASMNL